MEFAGNDILVGHGIANSDIPFLRRAAARAGVRFENRYFDTFRYAESLRGEFLSDSLRLGPLAQRLGVVQSREHRALDDAACAAGVYFCPPGASDEKSGRQIILDYVSEVARIYAVRDHKVEDAGGGVNVARDVAHFAVLDCLSVSRL